MPFTAAARRSTALLRKAVRRSASAITQHHVVSSPAMRFLHAAGTKQSSFTLRAATTKAIDFAQVFQLNQLHHAFSSMPYVDENYEDNKRSFADLEGLNPITKQTLLSQGMTTMTEIQAKTYEAASRGQDVIGRSRTGSGKTLAFLLPALERVLRDDSKPNSTRVLVISPTRELASQIDKSAQMLTAKHRNINSYVLYGGVPKGRDIRELERRMPTILTATPGRLQDHLQSSHINGSPFRDLLRDIDVLVLDEMDRLLE
jgi:superfamily II DNA/RNA helicase